MLDNLTIVLFRPKYPENVGGAARACANMGCPSLSVVAPRMWDVEKAKPMATAQGEPILERMRFFDDLPPALAGHDQVWGTTARTGGWRKGLLAPRKAAPEIMDRAVAGGRIAVVFGPEDRGLTNEEIQVCGRLLTIPTTDESSLNLAQAVLIVLYECFVEARERAFRPAVETSAAAHESAEKSASGAQADAAVGPRPATFEEREALMGAMREALLAIDYLKADNPDYWMLPVRRFFQRFPLRRTEFNMLMGVCRQVLWATGKAIGKR